MDIRQLQYILAIAQEEGVTRAAEKLFITQSALDQQLLKLERELGVQLFFRSKTGFELTPAGKVYVDYARRIVDLKNEAYLIIQDLAGRRRGTLTLAFAPERGMEMFMALYPAFYRQYPGLTVTPREMRVKQQLLMLQNDELDIGFVSMKKESAPGLACSPIVREQFVLITPKQHELAAYSSPGSSGTAVISLDKLENVPLSIMYRESTQREVIDDLFRKKGVQPTIFIETASNRANISMVEKGLSCSILPYWYVKDNQNVLCFRLEGEPSWSLSVCHRRGRYLSRAAQDFIERAREYILNENADPV